MKTQQKQQSQKKLVFSVRDGFRVSKQAARAVGVIIHRLVEKKQYTPKALVEAARDPRSPAHRFFEWKDSKAAELWRDGQARYYQRAIAYEVVIHGAKHKKTNVNMRVVYPVRDAAGERGYATGGAVSRDKDLMKQVIARAKADLIQWRERWKQLRKVGELSGVFDAIDEVAGRYKKAS